jgi:hypothetical protein
MEEDMGRFRHAGSAAIIGLALGLMCVHGAHAGVVISDNFSGSTPITNWPGDSTFLSIPQPGDVQGLPSVDLVGASNYPTLVVGLPAGAHAVDLDGSTGSGNYPAGELQSVQSLALGNYTVQFELAGNLRGNVAQTTVVCVGASCQSLTPANNQPYTLYDLTFTGVSGQVSFTDLGPSDQQGNLLADVVVYTPGPKVGEGLLGFAAMLALLIGARYRGLFV